MTETDLRKILHKSKVPTHSRKGRCYSLQERVGWLKNNHRPKYWEAFPQFIGSRIPILNYDLLGY